MHRVSPPVPLVSVKSLVRCDGVVQQPALAYETPDEEYAPPLAIPPLKSKAAAATATLKTRSGERVSLPMPPPTRVAISAGSTRRVRHFFGQRGLSADPSFCACAERIFWGCIRLPQTCIGMCNVPSVSLPRPILNPDLSQLHRRKLLVHMCGVSIALTLNTNYFGLGRAGF